MRKRLLSLLSRLHVVALVSWAAFLACDARSGRPATGSESAHVRDDMAGADAVADRSVVPDATTDFDLPDVKTDVPDARSDADATSACARHDIDVGAARTPNKAPFILGGPNCVVAVTNDSNLTIEVYLGVTDPPLGVQRCTSPPREAPPGDLRGQVPTLLSIERGKIAGFTCTVPADKYLCWRPAQPKPVGIGFLRSVPVNAAHPLCTTLGPKQ